MWTALVGVVAASLLKAEQPDKAIDSVRVFAVYEPVFSRQDVEILSRVHPDFVCRGWFKWHNTPDWQAYAPVAQACREKGILLQGGITCAALYPGENGIDDATFRDFACHGTDGQPFHCRQADGGGWYHLSLYNQKVVAMLKREVRLQIDAGAVGIWYDEIEGYYDWNPTEGYDPYACAAFRDWLTRTYCAGQGWREDDPRWQSRFGIDLAKHGGSIRSFDYLRHLQTTPGRDGKPLADNPPQGNPRGWATSANPLYREWGYAWNRKAAGTFRFDTVAALFADILSDANRYARDTYGRTLINTYNHNGTARPGVAFQQPHNGAQPPLRHNRLDGRVSYLSYYENLIADAAEVCPEQPVVFFVDWPGETDRLTAMTRADQTHFFSIYFPEAYAAGGEFALPLRGYSYVAAHQGTLGTLARMADFYREHAPFLRSSKPIQEQPQSQDRLTLRVRATAAGTAVHIVNHLFDTRDIWPQPRTNLTVVLSWTNPAPAFAFAVSPDFPEQRPVPLSLKDGRLTLDVGTVTCSALVLLPNAHATRSITGAAADGTHIVSATGRALAIARDGRFTLWLPPEGLSSGRDGRPRPSAVPESVTGGQASRLSLPDPTPLECLETGERLPARDSMTFAAPASGPFASGLLLDTFGIPARHTEIASGERRWHTDAWGRFRVPLSQTSSGQLTACVETGITNAFTLNASFTAWRVSASHIPIFSLAAWEPRPRGPRAAGTPPLQKQGEGAAVEGFWANWPDKERTPGVIALSREEHAGRSAMRCAFSPMPRVAWSNINSPAFQTTDATSVEVVYAGDGTPRTVHAVLHASQRFYRFPLSLVAKDWTAKRIALGEFRDDQGVAFDPAAITGNVAFQLAPVPASGGSASSPTAASATLWLHSVTLINETPVKELMRSDDAFDDVDVDQLRAGHQPLPPPPAVAARQPLLRFGIPSPKLLANWDGKSAAEAKPRVVIERVAPANEPPFLRVTFPAGECAWGNANIPLPAATLQGQSGLALRVRAKPANDTVALALHAAPKSGGQAFFRADCEIDAAWSEVVLPWRDFHRDDGSSFDLSSAAWVNLQICRPSHPLTHDLVLDIEQIDTFTVKSD
jgi:hypothetical protein